MAQLKNFQFLATMSLLDEDNFSSVYVWFSAMIWIIYTLILGAINVVHFRKTYQDLYTVERKSIAHRGHRSKNINSPDIFYKAAAILTCVLCFTYFMVALVIAILFNLLNGIPIRQVLPLQLIFNSIARCI